MANEAERCEFAKQNNVQKVREGCGQRTTTNKFADGSASRVPGIIRGENSSYDAQYFDLDANYCQLYETVKGLFITPILSS